MVKTRGLSHVALPVADPERSLEFYRAVLEVCENVRNESTVQVLGPGPHEVIAFEKRPAEAGRPGGILHFGFRLTGPKDIDAAGGIVDSQGEFAPGFPYAFVRDPDGYEIEIWFE